MSLRLKLLSCLALLILAANALLVPRLSAAQRQRPVLDEEGMREAATIADCSFSVDPDRFLQASARHRRDVSDTTVLIGSKLGRAHAASQQEVALAPLVRRNFIDDFILEAMEMDDIPRTGLASDLEFLRRVNLDLTGRIPSADEIRLFLADNAADKRDKKIDALLASPEFVDRWTMFFGDLLQNTAQSSTRALQSFADGRNAYYTFIKGAIASNKPYNQFAREQIAATGDSFIKGEANYILAGTVPMGPAQDTYDMLAVRTATVFLGINSFDCLLCHSGAGHLDSLNLWATSATRMDGWKMSSFFARVQNQRQAVNNVSKYIVSDRAAGEYQLNTTAGNRTPRLPEGTLRAVTPEYVFGNLKVTQGSYRDSLADMLTNDAQFARAAVNYLWAEMFGVGIVDPPDGFDLARLDKNNPPPAPWKLQPSHPDLLAALANEFIRSNYDVRHMIRLMARSSAYQMSSRFESNWQENYTRYFARKFVRRLSAEMVHDAVGKATGVLPSFTITGLPGPLNWAMQLPDTSPNEPRGASSAFLNVFLRGNRDNQERSSEASILQALTLMNSAFINARIHNNNNGSLVNRLVAQKKNDNEVIEELYLATLGRFATEAEKGVALKMLSTPSTRTRAIEDLQWALLNKVDFLYNY